MPNICSTTCTIKGDLSKLRKAMEEALFPNDVAEDWIGVLLLKLGMTKEDINNSGIYTRGDVVYYEGDDHEIILDIDSAWSPTLVPITMFCEKYAPEAEILYTAMEEGVGLYLTNNPEVAECYNCDSADDIDIYGFFTKDELKERLESVLDKKSGLPNLIKEITSKFEVYINKFQYCEVSDL